MPSRALLTHVVSLVNNNCPKAQPPCRVEWLIH